MNDERIEVERLDVVIVRRRDLERIKRAVGDEIDASLPATAQRLRRVWDALSDLLQSRP
jgi:hypothetical protein